MQAANDNAEIPRALCALLIGFGAIGYISTVVIGFAAYVEIKMDAAPTVGDVALADLFSGQPETWQLIGAILFFSQLVAATLAGLFIGLTSWPRGGR
jgi:hypothetical protein